MLIALTAFHVIAGQAQDTLPEYTSQAGLQVLYGFDDIRGIQTNSVIGEFDVVTALRAMLSGTPIAFEVMDGDTITLTVPPPPNPTPPVRINGHDYACTPLSWVVGMSYSRLGLLAYDMGLIDHSALHCYERPFDPALVPDAGEYGEVTVLAVKPRNVRRMTWGPRN